VPTIEFAESPLGREKHVEAPEGGALVDLCDEFFAPIPFSCRSATCGTCHVEILKGAELLEPPESDEQELLDLLCGPDDTRLACQAVVRAGPGVVRLRTLAE
jgi:ferredoxin